MIALLLWVSLISALPAETDAHHFRFGILKPAPRGEWELEAETTTIPRRLKDTGFRFGVSFDNLEGKPMKWYYRMQLPRQLKEFSGGLRQVAPQLIQTDTQRSNQLHVVDDFWFDEGDPLGPHHLELYIGDVRRFSVDFEVVEAR
jgi:hypothetical protein